MKKLFTLLFCLLLLFALASCDDATCQHRDADDNTLCDKCGESYTDGKDAEDSTSCRHRDADDNSLCDKCGKSYTDGKDAEDSTSCQHRDADDNSLCDKCGKSYTDGKDVSGGHTHNFTQETVDIKYLHTPASKYNPAIYWKSCACGEASTTATFTYGEVLEGNLTYRISSDSSFYIVSGFDGAQQNISIPNLHDGLPVFGIMENAFKDNTTIKSIIMPNSIMEIGARAFSGCTALESVIIPTSVTSIEPYTFSGCTALKTITLHSGIQTLGANSFERCSALKSITLNEGLKTIDDNAFDYCTSLQSISIPDTVTTLGNMAFRHAESLRSVKLSSALNSIGNATFQYCIRLESVTLHENIKTLGNSTFSYCDGLKSISILGNLTAIGTATFYECRTLESVYFASQVSGDVGNINYIFYNAGIDGSGIALTIAKDAIIPDGFFTPYLEDNMPKITKIVLESGSTTVNGFKKYNKLPYLTSITYPSTITDPAYGAFNYSLWWDNQEVGEVYINGIFYGYRCRCSLASPKSAVVENLVEATCTVDGSYDSVVYCSVCNCELKRTHEVISKKGHSPKSAVEENLVEATCTADGSYDSVVYCSVCNCELKRTHEVISKKGHSPKSAVKENLVEATCTVGRYDAVVYCGRCNDELSREEVTIPAQHKSTKELVCSACGEKVTYHRDGNYIYFGEYPQTIKADSVTITSTTDSRGYYLGSDGYYYATVTASPSNQYGYSTYTFSTGATVIDGKVYYFKVEPIRWRILSEDGESAFILCDSIIANGNYIPGSSNYRGSRIRSWLNDTFFKTAFTELQQQIILTTTVDNSAESMGYSSNPYACEDTEDKIFLLSYEEVTNSAYGFSSSYDDYDVARQMSTSDYSRATGAYMNTNTYEYYGNGAWWLRSIGYELRYDSYGPMIVGHRGTAGETASFAVIINSYGVVPALNIRL